MLPTILMPALSYAELQGLLGGPVTAHPNLPLSHRWWWHHDLPKGPGEARHSSRVNAPNESFSENDSIIFM